jgi:2-methylcitrate dehydratase PrpD
MTGLTRELARRAMSLRHDDIPAEIRALAVHCVLDTVGVAIAGADDGLVEILAAELAAEGTGAVQAWGRPERLPPLAAALLNGTAAHALDYDDVNLAMPGHPSVAILPALLALAEQRGGSGAAIITAFVAGYETACRAGRAVAPGHYDGLGFHATGTVGTFGAAAACAHLLGLDEERTLHALGIAATTAAGLKSMFGTMCKPLHAGRAAQAGLQAARLAARGFTARPDSIECPQGFAATHSADFNPEAALALPPGGWHIRNNLFKYHAACYLTHAGIEAGRKLRAVQDITPDRIAAVTLRVDRTLDRVCNIATPRTGLEAKFSLRLTAAMALAGTDTGRLDAYTDQVVANPALGALRDRVVVDFQQGWSQTRAEMELRLTDQTTLREGHDSGVPAADLAAQGKRIAEKFHGLAAPVLGEARAQALSAAIGGMDGETQLAPLTALWGESPAA